VWNAQCVTSLEQYKLGVCHPDFRKRWVTKPLLDERALLISKLLLGPPRLDYTWTSYEYIIRITLHLSWRYFITSQSLRVCSYTFNSTFRVIKDLLHKQSNDAFHFWTNSNLFACSWSVQLLICVCAVNSSNRRYSKPKLQHKRIDNNTINARTL
jgi:hypothetical protein